MNATDCKRIVSAIISDRFGLVREVEILSSDDCETVNRRRQEIMDRQLFDFDQDIRKAALTYDERIKNPPPADAQNSAAPSFGGWQRRAARPEAAPSNHDVSVFGALKARNEGNEGIYKTNAESILY